VSNNYLIIPKGTKQIDIPIEIKWDFIGQEDSIEIWEESVIEDVIGVAKDFEVLRFAHKEYGNYNLTSINYDFYFYDGPPDASSSVSADWDVSYVNEGFSVNEIYYYNKPFTKSFFKLDFYDTKDSKSQTNYFTVILPVQQGATNTVSISPLLPNVQIKKPSMTLDYVGADKEGFFFYWLRKRDFINVDTFYMTAKFFDARLGVFVKMMNEPQSGLSSKFLFEGSDYFYYKVKLDYTTKTYEIFDRFNVRQGEGTPINWYEYVNPPE
jgi:hypothetical protein